ncbi:hypothetical protein F7Q99_15670 [Streptomyces kaniharaensis]|uniref:Uncharacterized protein n=1 Tax=Streptomyces kaniharaensis TaxID=212423 RepID=A0A6N7KQF6_9ACTN|nr:hypothetical protein [Streptomyces kaniharaensis]MQS13671.1 hypothetical protein [Streptomyces kaniharaensis]
MSDTTDPVVNALAATRYAVAAAFNSFGPAAVTPAAPDDFDWPELEAFIHQLGFAADHSDADLNLYRLLTAVQRIAYREGAGRNPNWSRARLNPLPRPAD